MAKNKKKKSKQEVEKKYGTGIAPVSNKFTLNTQSNKKTTSKSSTKKKKKESTKKVDTLEEVKKDTNINKNVDKKPIAPVELKGNDKFTIKTPEIQRTEEQQKEFDKKTKKAQKQLATDTKHTVKKTVSGLTTGVTGIVDAPLQNIQEGEQKAEQEPLYKTVSKLLLHQIDHYGISELPDITKNAYNRFTNKDLTTWQKISQTGLELFNNNYFTNTLEDVGRVIETVDPVTKIYNKVNDTDLKSSEGLAQVREYVNKPSEKVQEWAEKDADKVSKTGQILGDTGQVVGNMIPAIIVSAATAGAGAPAAAAEAASLITMGVSAKGTSTRQAEKQGADLSQANDIGNAKAWVEVATEKLFGGLGKLFGKGALDDVAMKWLDDVIDSKGLNYVLKKGIGILGENIEEHISDLVDLLIDKGTVDPDAKYSFKDWLNTGLMTTLSTIVLNLITGGYSSSDFINNSTEMQKAKQTDNVQKIIEVELEERLNNEYNGKASAREIAQLQNEIIQDIQNGYISTDTIEKTLGGDTYNQLNEYNQKALKLQEEVNELQQKADKNELESLEEKQKLDDLKEEIKKLDNTELKTKLSNEVQDLIKNDTGLQESYNEVGRKKESYYVDLNTIENEKQRAIYQKAMESGVLNNSNKTHALVDMIAKISSDKNIDFDFTNNEQLEKSGFGLQGNVFEVRDANGKLINEFRTEAEAKKYISKLNNSGYKIENVFKNINGYESKNGIVINLNSTRAIYRIVGHELTHTFEGTTLYTELQDSLKEFVGESRWNDLVEQYEERYKDTDANAENELTSDLIGDYLFTDENFVRNLSVKHKTIFDKAYEQIKYLYNVATAGSSERRMLEKAKKVFDKLYNETKSRSSKNTKLALDRDTYKEIKVEPFNVLEDAKDYIKENKLTGLDGGSLDEFIQDFQEKNNLYNAGTEIRGIIDEYYLNLESSIENNSEIMYNNNGIELDPVEKNVLTSAINTDTPNLTNGKHYKHYGNSTYLFNKSEFNEYDFIGKIPIIGNEGIIYGNEGNLEEHIDAFYKRKGRYNRDSINIENRETTGRNDGVDNSKLQKEESQYRNDNRPSIEDSTFRELDNSSLFDDKKFSISRETGKLQENGNDVILETSDTGNTGTLMAIHNLNEEKANGVLDLGGFPYPSIAITNPSKLSHEGYGDISVLFNKDTINPELNSKNKVYSRDAYTPRFPTIEYKLNSNEISKLRKTIGDYDYRNAQPGDNYISDARSIIDNLEDNINRSGIDKTLDDIKNNDAMKYVYIKNTNPNFKVETKNEQFSNIYSNETLQRFLDNYDGKYELNDIPSNEVDNYTKTMVDAYKQQLEEEYDNPEIIQMQIKNLEDRFASKDNFLRAAYKLQKYGIEHQVLDTVATKEKINNSINQEDYNKWVDNQFKNIIEKKGLRNNKDYYTNSGTPRSFEQLHDEYTLDNVVKILDALDNTGAEGGMFTGVGEIAGNASIRFNNIEDIKANENLLTEIGNEEYGKMIEDIQDRLSNIEESIMDRGHNNSDNYFIARDNLSSAIADAARLYGENKKVDANRVNKILNEYGFNPNNAESQQIVDMFSELRQLPTQYFEAKPKRAVGLDETEQWVIPNTSSKEFKQRLQDLGLQYTEYDPNIEGDRQRVINQFDNLKFSVDRIPISKNFLTESEQSELDGLRALDNSGWTELTPEEQRRMQQLENKSDVVLDKKAEKMLRSASYKAINTSTKVAENYLDFDANQKKSFRNQMREFSNMTKDELVGADTYNKVKDIVSQYANREYTYFDDTVEGIKRELKHTKIRVTDEMKNQITDYGYFVRDSKLMLRRNSGTPVDQVYQEYSEMYPNFFDSDVWSEADQLERLNDFMNHDFSVTEKYKLTDEDLKNATDIIYNKLLDNSLSQQDLITTEEVLDKKVQKRTRTVVREELLDKMGITPELISEGNDISAINFARTDPVRVNEKVFGWKTGQLINDATVNFTKHQEAERMRFLNKERQEIKDLGIKARSKESELVQKYGEKQYVDKNNEVHPYTDAELNRDVKDVATREKIKNAARVLRQKYDTYIDKVNSVLTEMGYDEIPKRQDYMRHFVELDDKFSRWGLPFNKESMMAEDLPTDINGLTEFNRPGKSYFASANTRTGLQTTYDAITGIDGYLEGVSNLIYHTESIQRYRALTRFIRENYGREHGLDNIDLMTDEELADRIKDIQDNKLSKYVSWLDEQANSIAGKKGSLDRSVERMFGRRVYTALNTLKSQVGSNMTGFNVRSAMTNFASAIQGMSKTQKLAFVKGTVSTINNIIHDDGMINKSDFLTRRLLDTQSLALKPWQKISQAGQIFMNGTDYFTANQIWRSKYYENLSKGMSEQQAITNADDFAARIMGDRSKGSTAELFNSKTLGFLSQFQLEVNNQWSSLIHDNKIDIQKGNKTALGVTFELGQLFAASYLFNTLMKELTGSDVMIDPIDMLLKIFKPDDDDKDEGIVKRAQKVLGELINNLPFANLVTGGGRIPISEAFTGVKTLGKKLMGGTDNYGNEISWGDVKDDTLESLAYWVLPTGYGQLRKTVKGLSMYDDKLPIAGSYTDSGNLRFSAEDTAYGKIKAGLFGQYSSRYAQDYIDSGYKSINASKLDEMKDLDMNSTEYRDYREGLSAAGTSIEDKLNYISDLDVSDEDKTIMASNVAKKDIDMSEYKKYGSYDEFNYAQKNPAKYEVMKLVGGYDTYKNYEKAISEITADYDRNGKAITNSRKNKVIKYVNSLNLTRAQKAMLIKEQYPSFTQYDSQIASYVNNQNMSFIQKAGILKQLGFKAYDRQIINYIRENYRTVEEQQEELEKLGFKIYNYNGKTYVR